VRRVHVPRLIAAVLALGVMTGLATACTADEAGERSASSPAMTADTGRAPAPADSGGASSAGAKQDNQQVQQPGMDRRLIRTATVELAADDVAETVRRARQIAAGAGGYAGHQELRGDTATVTLHVPSDRFDRAVDDLSALGTVLAASQTAEDVTEQLVDVESRMTTQRASVERARALLARAGSVSEIVQIEGEVTRREADLESLQKRRETLAGQVAMSKATLRISKGASAAPTEPDDSGGFLGGLAGGWRALLTAGGVVLNVVGVLVPFLVVVGVPVAIAVRWWRRRRRAVAPAVRHQQAT
jgi:Domain of unknown function (DUF4349)